MLEPLFYHTTVGALRLHRPLTGDALGDEDKESGTLIAKSQQQPGMENVCSNFRADLICDSFFP